MASASVWVLFVLSALSVLSFAGEAAKVPAPPREGEAPAEPKEEERDLIGVLKDGQIFEKDRACRRLALIGSKEAVPAVAALLLDRAMGVLLPHLPARRQPALGPPSPGPASRGTMIGPIPFLSLSRSCGTCET